MYRSDRRNRASRGTEVLVLEGLAIVVLRDLVALAHHEFDEELGGTGDELCCIVTNLFYICCGGTQVALEVKKNFKLK